MRLVLSCHALVCLVCLVFVAGCGRRVEMGQVTGTVRAGGQPLANVLVTYIPATDGPTAPVRLMGTTDASGAYRLRTEQLEEGAAPGPYKVIIEDLAIYSAPRAADGTVLQLPPTRFDPQFADPLRSPLEIEVKSGVQTIDLEVGRQR
jgi:hypothetical protein